MFQSYSPFSRLGRVLTRTGPASSSPSAARFLPMGSPRSCGSKRSIFPRIPPPPDLAGGVSDAHQGGRPGGALPVSVGGEGSLPQAILWLCGHSACLRSPVHVHAWGLVCKPPARPRLPHRGHALLNDPPGRWKYGRENFHNGGYDHGPGRRQRQARGGHDCDVDKTCGRGGTAHDGNGDGDPRLRLALPIRGGRA